MHKKRMEMVGVSHKHLSFTSSMNRSSPAECELHSLILPALSSPPWLENDFMYMCFIVSAYLFLILYFCFSDRVYKLQCLSVSQMFKKNYTVHPLTVFIIYNINLLLILFLIHESVNVVYIFMQNERRMGNNVNKYWVIQKSKALAYLIPTHLKFCVPITSLLVLIHTVCIRIVSHAEPLCCRVMYYSLLPWGNKVKTETDLAQMYSAFQCIHCFF